MNIVELRELTLFERALWRIHFFFGYLAMWKTFDKQFARVWYDRSLATLDTEPEIIKEGES